MCAPRFSRGWCSPTLSKYPWAAGLQAAALHLAYAEYDDMSTLERMAILRGLCGLLLSSDAAREVVTVRMEAIAALQPKPKVPCLCCHVAILLDLRGHRASSHPHINVSASEHAQRLRSAHRRGHCIRACADGGACCVRVRCVQAIRARDSRIVQAC